MNLILKKPTFQDKDKWLLYVKEYRKFALYKILLKKMVRQIYLFFKKKLFIAHHLELDFCNRKNNAPFSWKEYEQIHQKLVAIILVLQFR